MANIFKQTNDVNNDVNRNTFDLSFQNNLTLKFGTLYPVFLKEGLPGSSFKIKPSFGLNFMPMVFPVQTRIRAYLHFFKVRKRSLWDGFMDYVSKNKASLKDSMPYLDLSNFELFKNVAQTGSLGDYLGIPTTIVGDYGNYNTYAPLDSSGGYPLNLFDDAIIGNKVPTNPKGVYFFLPDPSVVHYNGVADVEAYTIMFKYDVTDNVSADLNAFSDITLKGFKSIFGNSNFKLDYSGNNLAVVASYTTATEGEKFASDSTDLQILYNDLQSDKFNVDIKSDLEYALDTILNAEKVYLNFIFKLDKTTFDFDIKDSVCTTSSPIGINNQFVKAPYDYTDEFIDEDRNQYSIITYKFTGSYTLPVVTMPPSSSVLALKDLSYGNTPYYDSVNNPDGIKLNALPFRAYESIYNAFYRNILNDPFILDGTPEYNKFLPTTKGGADVTPYTFHARYWEDDFLTTAIQNPQASDFPVVVGITNLNGQGVGLSVRDEEGNNYQLKATISEDGKSITKFDVTDLPQSEIITNPKAFIDLAQSGISITDFRCANALQRWLEMNARKGLRFKDIIKGRFDVDIRFDELNMPEFIGGDTADVSIGQINQSVGSRDGNFDDVLGSYAGQASCMKRSDNAITTFCDEPCYIIGLLSVVPVANYSQLLPKLFTKRDILDEFSPEFAHIGYQPIPYAEVCPTQAFMDPDVKLSDPFGYQRAWYDYIASTDEVHGQFRTSLRNFLVNRVFGSRPILSHSFLTVNNDDINDIFSVTADTDKILGQVYFDCKVKHPIPKFGIPKLEA